MSLFDLATYIPILILTIALFWLYNKEIKKSLEVSKRAEEALTKDRNSLKAVLEERTKELKENRLTRISELAKAAEFGRLSQGLFHDLMTPLTSMVLHTEKLKDAKATEASTRMTAYIKDIRSTLSREESERLCSISEELETVVHLLNYKARENRVEICIHETDPLTYYGNPIKLRQIFSNLISNAIDSFEKIDGYSARKIDVNLGQDKQNITIEVRDNGCGIAPENIKKIFEPFYSTKPIDKGTGIGLTTVKSIVENNLKGSIEVKSEVGVGTTFTITFPQTFSTAN